MNREQRRRQQRNDKQQQSYYKGQQRSSQSKLHKEMISHALTSVCDSAALLALHDKFGFGKKRLDQFRVGVYNVLLAVSKGYVTVADIHDTLQEEVYSKQRSNKAPVDKQGLQTGKQTNKEKESISSILTSLYIKAALLTLHDKFGFGQKRLEQFQTEISKVVLAILNGAVTVTDIQETLRKEVYQGQTLQDETELLSPIIYQ